MTGTLPPFFACVSQHFGPGKFVSKCFRRAEKPVFVTKISAGACLEAARLDLREARLRWGQ